jgi:putative oxidoreductase
MTTATSSNSMQDNLALIGRLLIAYLFLPTGFNKLMNFAGTVGYVTSKGVPLPEVAAAIAVIVEVGLALLLVFGWKTRWVAAAMAVYVLVITPIFHGYWAVPAAQMTAQKINFDKNLAIVGGFLLLVAYGAGRWSVDGARRRI